MPAWLLLAAAPGWVWTQRLVHAVWVPGLLACAYLGALVVGGPPPEGAGFMTLEGVKILFTNELAVLGGWIHYLCFDLFVGAWEVRDARRRGIHHGLVLPCLFFTLMLGPIGLGMYFLIRAVRTRATTLVEA